MIAKALLAVHAVLLQEFTAFEKQVRKMARSDTRPRLLMSTPAVGPIVALTYASAIDDPARFKSSKQVGAHFGLTPKKYQSGETDYTGRISKIGDGSVRTALYEAAHIMLTKPLKGCSALKSWAMRIAKRAGMNKAKVALARKLAVIMHRMLADGKPFKPRCSLTGRDTTVFGRVTTPGLLEAKSLRRDDGSGQAAIPPVASRPRFRRLVDLSSSNPIRWRPRPDRPGDPPYARAQRRLAIARRRRDVARLDPVAARA